MEDTPLSIVAIPWALRRGVGPNPATLTDTTCQGRKHGEALHPAKYAPLAPFPHWRFYAEGYLNRFPPVLLSTASLNSVCPNMSGAVLDKCGTGLPHKAAEWPHSLIASTKRLNGEATQGYGQHQAWGGPPSSGQGYGQPQGYGFANFGPPGQPRPQDGSYGQRPPSQQQYQAPSSQVRPRWL